MKHTFKYFLILWLSVLSLYSMDRQFTVLSPYGGKELKTLGYLDDSGEFQQLRWGQQRRSPVYTAPSSGDITLVKPVILEDGLMTYQPVLELPWPGDTHLALFAVVVIDGELAPTVLGIDDREESFPRNTLKVLNGLNRTIYMLAGESKFELRPAALSDAISTVDYQVIDRVFEEDEEVERNPGMPIAVGVEANGEYGLIYASGIGVSPNRRVLCLVLPPKKKGTMRYQARVVVD
jgi:hypothetical protein